MQEWQVNQKRLTQVNYQGLGMHVHLIVVGRPSWKIRPSHMSAQADCSSVGHKALRMSICTSASQFAIATCIKAWVACKRYLCSYRRSISQESLLFYHTRVPYSLSRVAFPHLLSTLWVWMGVEPVNGSTLGVFSHGNMRGHAQRADPY